MQSRFSGFFGRPLVETDVRVRSEIAFRGFGKISAYQKMGMVSVLYMLTVTLFLPGADYIDPEIINGLDKLWNPALILALQLFWLVSFLIFGRSTVTTASVSFERVRKHI